MDGFLTRRRALTPDPAVSYPEAAGPLLDLGPVLDADAAGRAAPRYLLGTAADRSRLWWDPARPGPLQVVSGEGQGTTSLLRSLVVQALRAGAVQVTVLDRRDGRDWAALASWERVRVVAARAPYNGPVPPGVEVGTGSLAEALADAAAAADRAHVAAQFGRALPRRLVVVDGLSHLLQGLKEQDREAGGQARSDLARLFMGSGQGTAVAVASLYPAPFAYGMPPVETDTLALGSITASTARRMGVRPVPRPPYRQPGRWLTTHPDRPGQCHTIAAPTTEAARPRELAAFAQPR